MPLKEVGFLIPRHLIGPSVPVTTIASCAIGKRSDSSIRQDVGSKAAFRVKTTPDRQGLNRQKGFLKPRWGPRAEPLRDKGSRYHVPDSGGLEAGHHRALVLTDPGKILERAAALDPMAPRPLEAFGGTAGVQPGGPSIFPQPLFG